MKNSHILAKFAGFCMNLASFDNLSEFGENDEFWLVLTLILRFPVLVAKKYAFPMLLIIAVYLLLVNFFRKKTKK